MRKNQKLAAFFILFLMITVIINPAQYLPAISDGLLLFWATVLPALFPFFFFTKILSGLGFPDAVARLFEKPVRVLFHAPPISSYIMVMSMLSGYPIGARLISDFYKNGLLTTEESKKIVAFSSTSSPVFVIGTLGALMLGNIKYGVIILAAHYISALLTGLIFRGKKTATACLGQTIPSPPSTSLISDSVNSAVTSLLAVGGLIAVFSLIISVLQSAGLLSIFGDGARPVLTGLLEITTGAREVIKNPPSVPLLLGILTGLTSFGGLCIFLQAYAFLSEAHVGAGYYFAVKAVQGFSGFLIGYTLGFSAAL